MDITLIIKGLCRFYILAGVVVKHNSLIPLEEWVYSSLEFYAKEILEANPELDRDTWVGIVNHFKTFGWEGKKYGRLPSVFEINEKIQGGDIMQAKIKELAQKVVDKAKHIKRFDMGFIGDPIADSIIKSWGGLWNKTGGEILHEFSYNRMYSDFIDKYNEILKNEKVNVKGYIASPQNYCKNQTTSNLLLSSGDNVEKTENVQEAPKEPQKYYTKEDIVRAREDAFSYLDNIFNNMLDDTPKIPKPPIKIETKREEFLSVFGCLLKPHSRNKYWGVVI